MKRSLSITASELNKKIIPGVLGGYGWVLHAGDIKTQVRPGSTNKIPGLKYLCEIIQQPANKDISGCSYLSSAVVLRMGPCIIATQLMECLSWCFKGTMSPTVHSFWSFKTMRFMPLLLLNIEKIYILKYSGNKKQTARRLKQEKNLEGNLYIF